jgi:hypothetical protein
MLSQPMQEPSESQAARLIETLSLQGGIPFPNFTWEQQFIFPKSSAD